jgi:multidrug efflux pump subunit AcrB
MGFQLTIFSMIGLLGLAGILVNNSIILVSRFDDRLKEGMDVAEAAVQATQDRFRAILLTSLTTVGGLCPLLFETSLQAQFLLPMAITITFGLGTATLFVMVLGALAVEGWRRYRPRPAHLLRTPACGPGR